VGKGARAKGGRGLHALYWPQRQNERGDETRKSKVRRGGGTGEISRRRGGERGGGGVEWNVVACGRVSVIFVGR